MRNRCHQPQRIVILINAEGIVQISFYFALGRAGKFSFIVRQLAEDRLILCRKIICEESKRGAVVLLTSHISQDICELCDAIFQVNSGACSLMAGGST